MKISITYSAILQYAIHVVAQTTRICFLIIKNVVICLYACETVNYFFIYLFNRWWVAHMISLYQFFEGEQFGKTQAFCFVSPPIKIISPTLSIMNCNSIPLCFRMCMNWNAQRVYLQDVSTSESKSWNHF